MRTSLFLIYGCEIVVQLSSMAWRARNSFSSSALSFSAQPGYDSPL